MPIEPLKENEKYILDRGRGLTPWHKIHGMDEANVTGSRRTVSHLGIRRQP